MSKYVEVETRADEAQPGDELWFAGVLQGVVGSIEHRTDEVQWGDVTVPVERVVWHYSWARFDVKETAPMTPWVTIVVRRRIHE